MEYSDDIKKYIEAHADEALDLLRKIARIPSPSGHEERRAEFCCEWLRKQGAINTYIDDALNVICPFGNVGEGKLAVFLAHSDVVFPDTEELPLSEEDGFIRCPGVIDDTVNAVSLLMTAKYLTENEIIPTERGLLIVINSCEEGLGNLKGSRKIMENFGDRTDEFFTMDLCNRQGTANAVGSKRYLIRINTEGGHSYGDFGRRNAIAELAGLITDLYGISVPEKGKTTYNVGTITGGTSVNTIAQSAEMLYEFRSDERSSLKYMEEKFTENVEKYRMKGLDVTVMPVGDRPCSGNVDEMRLRKLMQRADSAAKRHFGTEITFVPASTDCNIPLSLGIPAVCAGFFTGGGMHTREEFFDTASLVPGICAVTELVVASI